AGAAGAATGWRRRRTIDRHRDVPVTDAGTVSCHHQGEVAGGGRCVLQVRAVGIPKSEAVVVILPDHRTGRTDEVDVGVNGVGWLRGNGRFDGVLATGNQGEGVVLVVVSCPSRVRRVVRVDGDVRVRGNDQGDRRRRRRNWVVRDYNGNVLITD